MLDPLAILIGFFLICFLVLIIAVGVTFLYRQFTGKPSELTHILEDKNVNNEIEENSTEDSQGDGLFIADDDTEDLFPPEFDDA